MQDSALRNFDVEARKEQRSGTNPTSSQHRCPPGPKTRSCNGRTFSNMVFESLKSFSIASTSASLGTLFVMNRPVSRCMRCILEAIACDAGLE
jgi:hypothetical protein